MVKGLVYLVLVISLLGIISAQVSVDLSKDTGTTTVEIITNGTDTNESVHVGNLIDTDCSGTDKVVGVQANGTVLCAADEDSGSASLDGNASSICGDDEVLMGNDDVQCLNLNDTITDLGAGGNASWNESYAREIFAPNTTGAIQQLINFTVVLFQAVYSLDWTNISITESQISDLSHTVDTSAAVNCSGAEVFLGNGTCQNLTSGYVPYSGAINNVNLGAYVLYANVVAGNFLSNIAGDTVLNLSIPNTIAPWEDATHDLGEAENLRFRNAYFSGNITADYYHGDGSLLTNLPSGGNASWNQSFANELYTNQTYVDAKDTEYNGSAADLIAMYNSSMGDLVAYYNSTVAASNPDNASWNESYAKTLFTNQTYVDAKDTEYNGSMADLVAYYNTTMGQLVAYFNTTVSASNPDNASWNESYAKTLFTNQTYVDAKDTEYNNSVAGLVAYYNTTMANLVAYYNSTVAASNPDNASWNESYAKTLFTNQTYVDAKDTEYNGSAADLIAMYNSSMGDLVDYFNTTVATSGDNVTWNQSHADTLYAGIEWDYNQTTPANTYTDTEISNIDIADLDWENDWMIVYSDGDGLVELPFGDEDGNFLMSNGEGALSWESATGDNASWNESYAKTLFTNQTYVDAQDTAYNDSMRDYTLYVNTTVSNLVAYYNTTMGNLIAYFNTTVFIPEAGNASWNESYANTLYTNQTYVDAQDTAYNDSMRDYTLYVNGTMADLVAYYNTTVATSGDNASWNESYANTLYTNQTYVDAKDTEYNGSMNDLVVYYNTSMYNLVVTFNSSAGDLAAYYNTSLASIVYNYTLHTISTTQEWTANQNFTINNLTDLDCIIFDSGGKICSG